MLSAIILLCIVVAIMEVFFSICKCNRCRFSEYFVDPLFHFVRVTFGDHIKKKEGSQKYTFYHYEISSWQIIILSTVTLMLLLPTFMSFWVSFIANETFVCDPQLDCFLRYPSTHIVSSSEPLDDCTSYDGTDSTVICFQFVFDFTKGFFYALCFIVVALIYCRMCAYVLIWFRELFSKYQKVLHCNMSVLLSFIMEILTFIFALIVIVMYIVSFLSNMVFQTGIIFWVYVFSFVYIGPLAIVIVLGGAKKVTTRCHK